MIVKGIGKVRSFEISPKILFFASLFFALYVLTSVLVINDYFEKRRQNQDQAKQLQKAQRKLGDMKRDLYRSEQHMALLEDYIQRIEKTNSKPIQPSRSEKAEKKSTAPPTQVASLQMNEDLAQAGKVDIKDLATHKEGAKISVNFKVVNTHEGERPIRGYVHILAIDKTSDPHQVWTYPKVALRHGIPTNYKRGQLFFIKRFKTIHGEIYLSSNMPPPTLVKVLVFNRTGDLIFEREFELEDES
jgi:hypothetical protein